MTINWERESGERIEEFAAAYLLLRAGQGNQIRPSQGDHGIDVQIPTSNGWEIYQVKRFAHNLSSSEKRQITKSWNRFEKDVLAKRRVHSWSLVLPLEPTPENETWLAELTDGSGIEIQWIGRATLDGWASEKPQLVDYYFGDGGRRLHELMSLAFSGSQPLDADEGEPLLASIQQRIRDLNRALDEVDPFYRYEIEVRAGSFEDIPTFEALRAAERPGLVESVMQAIDDDHYLVTHIIARSLVSTQLRPIRGEHRFVAESPDEREALERFFLYGAPLTNASGTIEASEGPPGSIVQPGTQMTAWTITPLVDDRLPPLEVRLVEDGELLSVVPVTAATSSAGVMGEGIWLRVQLGPAATIEYFVGAADRDDSIKITTDRAVGADPEAVLPTVDLVARMPGASIELNVRNGPPFMPARTIGENDISTAAMTYARFIKALVVVQRHTYSRVVVPDITDPSSEEVRFLMRAAALLDGKVFTGTFAESIVNDDGFFRDWDDAERGLVTEQPITINIGGHRWDTNMNERQEFESVKLDRTTEPPTLRAGRSNKVRMIATPRNPGES